MGIMVYVGNECRPKTEQEITHLAKRVAESRRLEGISTEWQEKDPTKTAEQIFLTKVIKDRDGTEMEVKVSLAERRMDFYDLQNYLSECTRCPVNVAADRFAGGTGSGFGCFVSLEFPISAEFEMALLAGAKRAIENKRIEPSVAFVDKIAKEKVTGTPIAQLRQGAPKTMQSEKPMSFTYGGFLSKHTLTTDQILELLLRERIEREDAMLFHHFLECVFQAMKEAGKHSSPAVPLIEALSAVYAAAADKGHPVFVTK